MKLRLLLPATLLALLGSILMSMSANTAHTAANYGQQSMFDRVAANKTPAIALDFDFDLLTSGKNTEDYVPASFSLDADHWPAEVKVRGRYRRRVCGFPPLSVKFSKSVLQQAGLATHNKYKLVTHCDENLDYADNLGRELLAYELYRLITGEGFKAQIVQVTYRDTKTGTTIERPALLLEDTDELAQNLNSTECEDCFGGNADNFATGNLEQLALFQYMIGNTDWNVAMAKNVKILRNNNGGSLRAVPYDFDFSGLVQAEYAKPNPDFHQTDITQRIWRWDFATAPAMQPTQALFLQKETAIFALVETYPHLSERSRRQVRNYLAGFFGELRKGNVPSALP